jgi:hypothetical protein
MTSRETFVRDLQRDPRLIGQADLVENLAKILEGIDFNGDDDENERSLANAFEFILGQKSLTLEQRAQHVIRLCELIQQQGGKIENLSLKSFIGLQ